MLSEARLDGVDEDEVRGVDGDASFNPAGQARLSRQLRNVIEPLSTGQFADRAFIHTCLDEGMDDVAFRRGQQAGSIVSWIVEIGAGGYCVRRQLANALIEIRLQK